ncbi:hypothetical protein GC207_04060 [bacterium]|nr:hypothetical protein [bacterium]
MRIPLSLLCALPDDFLQGLMPGSVYQGKDMNMRIKSSIIASLLIAGCFAGISRAQQPGESQSLRRYATDPATGRPITVKDQQFATDPVTGQPIPVKDPNKHFDLEFNGGTPKEFVEAINAQSGLKVNVIIPKEEAEAQLPAVDVANVTIPQLFEAVTAANDKKTNFITGMYFTGPPTRGVGSQATPQWQSGRIVQGFKTNDNPPTQDSIWYFFTDRPAGPPEIQQKEDSTVQVYQLARLLAKGYTIDDITTAIKTAWQMLDSSVQPEMKYHSDTGLLVARGTIVQLTLIRDVMAQLDQGRAVRQEPANGSNSRTGNPESLQNSEQIKP